MDTWATPEDLERAAAAVLPEDVYGFIAGGADDERAVQTNLTAFASRALHPRVLAHAGNPDPSVEVLGHRLAAPVIVAPMGMQCLIHPDGEIATAGAANDVGVGYALATGSSVAMEEVVAAAGPARWFQLYLLRDRKVSQDLVERALASGYTGIFLTADVPVVGRRPRDRRSPLDPAAGVRNANFEPYASIDAGYHSYVGDIEPDIGWDDVDWLVDVAGPAPVVIKGILQPDDARRAVDHGAAGIVVSNHGGRQLGRAVATIDVLEPIAAAVAGTATVLFDSGIRRGADVVTAVALGADAVLVGRPVMWSLAVGGRAAVAAVLDDLVSEIRRTMTLLGARTIADLTPDLCGVPAPRA